MHVGRIAGATRNLGAPPDWDETAGMHCQHLPIRDEMTEVGPAMTSAWIPTPEDVARIQAGAPIYLTIIGCAHPVVAMSVGAPAETA